MIRDTFLKITTVCLLLIMGIAGCGDDSTGPDPGEAPSLPTIQNQEAQPDVSFFQENQPKVTDKEVTAETSNYYAAQRSATSAASFFAMNSFYGSFLSPASGEEPTFENGQWIWSYNYTYEGVTAEFRLTAEEVPDGYNWAMFISYDDGQGNSIDDYKVMEGTTSADGKEGDWTFNSINEETNQETAYYKTSWVITSDTQKEMSFQFYESGSVAAQGDYSEDQPEYTLTLNYTDQADMIIFWNTETNSGYISQGGEKQCWDENFQDVSCS